MRQMGIGGREWPPSGPVLFVPSHPRPHEAFGLCALGLMQVKAYWPCVGRRPTSAGTFSAYIACDGFGLHRLELFRGIWAATFGMLSGCVGCNVCGG